MARISAFRAIRPTAELAERFAALPYDVYTEEEARAEVRREPLSFLAIDRPETQFPEGVDPYAPQVYRKAHDQLWRMVKEGRLVQEETPCYYVYEMTMDSRSQTGLVACASVEDYLSGVIRRHENTREEKERDRICHLEACDAQTGPILLAYRRNDRIRVCLERAKREKSIFDFTAPDGIRHRGWRISGAEGIHELTGAFAEIPRLYIADGHHRAAAAVKVAQRRMQEGVPGAEDSGFLSVLFAEEELRILDYNRIAADRNGLSVEALLHKISEHYEIGTAVVGAEGIRRCRPQKRGEVGMALGRAWYLLRLKEEFRPSDPVGSLDVSCLQSLVLEPVLGIADPRTNDRISFVGGIRGLEELEHEVHQKGGVAFAMYPTSMAELFAVADEGLLMPPKSTWFEPKLRSGLFIHSLR